MILDGCIYNKPKKKLTFSIENSTEHELKNLTIGLYDTILKIDFLARNSNSKPSLIKLMYPYNLINFTDIHNRKYHFQPIDNVGEELIKYGDFKYVIESIDTINQKFNFRIDYK